MYTIGDKVTPLQKYHTHEDIIHRKKRVSKKQRHEGQDDDTDKDYADVDYLLVTSDKKDNSGDEDAIVCVYDDN